MSNIFSSDQKKSDIPEEIKKIVNGGAFVVPILDTEYSDASIKDFVLVKSFNKFCKACKSPVSAMKSFIISKVKYEDVTISSTVTWPNDLIRKKSGNCLDFAIFMHNYFEYKGLPNTIGFVTFVNLEIGQRMLGHVFPIYKDIDNHYYIWNYFGDDEGEADINGGFVNLDHLVTKASPYFDILYSSYYKKNIYTPIRDSRAIYLRPSELKKLDKFTGQDISQYDLCNKIDSIKELIASAEVYASNVRSNTVFLPQHMFRFSIPIKKNIKDFFKLFK